MVDGSPILADAEAPDWARLVLVVRNGQVLEAHEIGGPQAGDFGYYLAPPQRAHDLDALFIARETAP